MAKKAKKAKNVKKAKKKPAKKSLKLRRKALRDLPAKKTSTKVKGGSTLTDSLTPSQRAELQSKLDAQQKVYDQQKDIGFAPPYVPVRPTAPPRPL
jgi:hypothetical protein